MLVVFDIDGTLIAGESTDWKAFEQALQSVLKFTPDDDFYTGVSDITAQRLAEAAVAASQCEAGCGFEQQVQAEYLRFLQLAHAESPDSFPLRPGASLLLEHLCATTGFSVAFATGDWSSSIAFKLSAAGIDLSHHPFATSTDAASRADIIRCAAHRAGRPLTEVVYVGDGTWDLRTCRSLGIPFIATGSRTDKLREMGAEHIVEPLEIGPFMRALQAIKGA